MLGNKKKILSWTLRIIIVVIFIQSLFFKFTGARESILIFAKIGFDPWGRYIIGLVELVAAILLLTKHPILGATLSLMIMIPAIIFHTFSIGLTVQNDYGLLFILALIVTISSAIILYLEIRRKGKVIK